MPSASTRWLAPLFALALTIPSAAQDDPAAEPDRITLNNGDVLTGTIKTMADGKMMFHSPVLGDLELEIGRITDIATSGPVKIQTKAGELYDRRITGYSGGTLLFAAGPAGGPEMPSLKLDDVKAINPPDKPAAKWSGAINLAFAMSEGNTNRRAVVLQGDATRRSEFDRMTAKAAWAYADDKIAPGQRNLTERRVEGSLKYDYFVSEHLYFLATAGAKGDTPADIDLRLDVGAGLGYQWIETDDVEFFTEAGISYFTQRYRSLAPEIDTVTARFAYGLKWNIEDGVKFLQDVEYQQGLEISDEVWVTKDSRLQLNLTDSMIMQGQWIMDFNNTPSPGLDRIDNQFLLSIGWTF